MSAQATQAWLSLSKEQADHLEQIRRATDERHRPSAVCVRDVGYALAWRHGSGGYVDSAITQICADLGNRYKGDQVQRALSCLEQAGLWVTVRKSTQGKKGKKGRAARRVPTFVPGADTKTDPNHLGAYPHTINDESPGGNDRITWGLDPNHLGAYPHPLKQIPKTNSYAETVSEQVRVTTADSLQKGKKNKEQEPQTQQLPAHIAHSTFEQMTTRALDFAANADPMFKPGKGWFISNRGKMQHTLLSLINRYEHAPKTALEQAAALEFYNELDPGGTLQHKHPYLYEQLTGDTPTQANPDSPGEQIAAMFALPPDAVSF